MKEFDSLIGQKHAIELLTEAVNKNRIAPAYLFVGPPGVGKALAAKCFIELLFSTLVKDSRNSATISHRVKLRNHPDLFWVEPTYLHQGKRLSVSEASEAGLKRKSPPQIRLEQIREIGEFLSRPPLEIARSVVVIEQAETMAEGAANGLLKTLEEPGRATIILIAPSLDSLLPTLISRCQRIPFYRLNQDKMKQILKLNGHEEILSHPEILAMAQGSPGDAIASWEQLKTISEELLKKLKPGPKKLKDALELAKEIDKNLDTEAQLWLVDYLQQSYWRNHKQGTGEHDKLPLQQLEKARGYLLSYVQPKLVWECTLMAICQG